MQNDFAIAAGFGNDPEGFIQRTTVVNFAVANERQIFMLERLVGCVGEAVDGETVESEVGFGSDFLEDAVLGASSLAFHEDGFDIGFR